MKIITKGIANISSKGEMLDVFFPYVEFGEEKISGEITNINDNSNENS